MNYMLLIYDTPATARPTEAEQTEMMGAYFAFTQEIVNSGELVAGGVPPSRPTPRTPCGGRR